MTGPDDAGLRVGEENGAAIGARDAEGQTGRPGRETVAARPVGIGEGFGHDRGIRRMHKMGHDEPVRRDPEGLGHAATVLPDGRTIVARTGPAVERSVKAGRHAADTREEAMREARMVEQPGGDRGRLHRGASDVSPESGKPGGIGTPGAVMQRALNSSPMPGRSGVPASTSRASAASMSSA